MGHLPPWGAWHRAGLMVTNAGRPSTQFGARVGFTGVPCPPRPEWLAGKLRGSEPSSQRRVTGRMLGRWGSQWQTYAASQGGWRQGIRGTAQPLNNSDELGDAGDIYF